ncbi:hypothetical protein TEK04_09200 [Klenkia sp. LSe6-5]|uniref:Flp pilus-assembly TadE/G-like n=1 Tax=Klenkia sesuvii TaxID=3103137 RepID=A0ABU8DSQ7_9ACTN
MRRLTARRLWVRGPAGERGAVAVAVALLIPLLSAAAALAVDTTASWMARNQVITGADAAALAEAIDCAEGDCGSMTEIQTKISYYFIENNAGSKLATLQPGTGWIQYDTGQRATRSQGTWTIRHLFAAVLGSPTSTLTVESMARWSGAPSATADLPLAVSWCAFRSTLTQGVGLPSSSTTLKLATDTAGASCTGPAGGPVRGTTALTASSGGCTTASVTGQVLTVPTTAPAACSASYLAGLVGQDVWVPVYDQSSSTAVRVYGYAALHVTSVRAGSPATVTGYWDWSAHQISTPDAVPTAPDLGARAVFLWDPDTWQGRRCPC